MNGKTGVRQIGLVHSWHRLKDFAVPCASLKESDCSMQVVSVHGPVLQVSTVERWPKLGCDFCMDVHSECLLMNQRCEITRGVLYERQL